LYVGLTAYFSVFFLYDCYQPIAIVCHIFSIALSAKLPAVNFILIFCYFVLFYLTSSEK